MSFEATKSLSGARQLVKMVKWNLESITDYSSPSFDNSGSGRTNAKNDRILNMLIRKERIEKEYTVVLDACLYLEEASQVELDSVDDLELRALIQFRYVNGMSWPEIAREIGQNITPDAIKKRFERGIRVYEEKGVTVCYPPNAKRALEWLNRAKSKIATTTDMKQMAG